MTLESTLFYWVFNISYALSLACAASDLTSFICSLTLAAVSFTWSDLAIKFLTGAEFYTLSLASDIAFWVFATKSFAASCTSAFLFSTC